MANQKALTEKEKGNAAFKKGDYATAIGHYTAASLADRTDPTYPLNRAAAYLKLGKFDDAERDTCTVLSLSTSNAKALFRRGQARVGLGRLDDALTDFTQALQKEPTNELVKDEIKKTNELLVLRKSKGKSTSQPSTPSPAFEASPPHRRRVPIKIVDSSSASVEVQQPRDSQPSTMFKQTSPEGISRDDTSTDAMRPISTRSLKIEKESSQAQPQLKQIFTSSSESQDKKYPPEAVPNPGPYSSWRANPPSSPSATSANTGTFTEAKEARGGRSGGGIFRASGASTIFPSRDRPTPAAAAGVSPLPFPTGAGTGSASLVPSLNPDRNVHTSASVKSPVPASTPEIVMASSGRTTPAFETVTTPMNMTTKAPMSLFDFQKAWEINKSDEERWDLLRAIPPLSLPSLFKTSLEPSLFVSIMTVFESVLGFASAVGANASANAVVWEYMNAFQRVDRFGTVVLFLSKEEKAIVRGVWEKLGVNGEGDVGDDKARRVWRSLWA